MLEELLSSDNNPFPSRLEPNAQVLGLSLPGSFLPWSTG